MSLYQIVKDHHRTGTCLGFGFGAIVRFTGSQDAAAALGYRIEVLRSARPASCQACCIRCNCSTL